MKVSLEMLVSNLTPEQAKWFAARVERDAKEQCPGRTFSWMLHDEDAVREEVRRDPVAGGINALLDFAEDAELTDEEVRAELRLDGIDPDAVAQRMLARIRLKHYHDALEDIARPHAAMQRRAEVVGGTVDGAQAVALANDAGYLRDIARRALDEH